LLRPFEPDRTFKFNAFANVATVIGYVIFFIYSFLLFGLTPTPLLQERAGVRPSW
jgi:hypothetical protein